MEGLSNWKISTLGLQHVLAMYAGAVIVPLIVGPAIGLTGKELEYLISIDLFMCGIATLLQVVGGKHIGVKLPVKEVEAEDIHIDLDYGQKANIISIIPNSIVTKHEVQKVPVEHGRFQPSVAKDLMKMAVIERHSKTGNICLGILHGLGLKSGAIASTFAHDSHNIIVAGTNDPISKSHQLHEGNKWGHCCCSAWQIAS